MNILKKKRSNWICYPENRTEFDQLVELLRKQFGRSHWSVFNQTWTTRQKTSDELTIGGGYYRVVEIHNKNIATLVQLTWG